MPWKQKIAGGFGSQDVIFASHPLDEQRAKEAIKDAKAVVWHVYKNFTAPGIQQDHIEKQVARAKQLW